MRIYLLYHAQGSGISPEEWGQKKAVSAAVVTCTRPMQDEMSQHFSVEGEGADDLPPKKTHEEQ